MKTENMKFFKVIEKPIGFYVVDPCNNVVWGPVSKKEDAETFCDERNSRFQITVVNYNN
jgi:hypothetical protein